MTTGGQFDSGERESGMAPVSLWVRLARPIELWRNPQRERRTNYEQSPRPQGDGTVRDSALINRCLRVAEHNGLSSEETMVLLAYNALCQMEEMWCRQLKLTMLDMRAPLMRESADNQGQNP